MKATLFFLVYLISMEFVCAQEINCVEKQKEISQLVNDAKYKQANEILPLLRKKCASQSEELYQVAIKILQYNVDASNDNKEANINDLLKLYDQYDANFPNNKNGNSVNKAMLLYDNKKGTDAEIYTFLNKAFTNNKEQFTNPNALYIYFKLYNENYKTKKASITLEQLLDKFNDVLLQIEKTKVAYPKKSAEYTNASRACKFLIKDYLVPENLIPLAEKKFDANTENIEWLEAMAVLLSNKCVASPIFGKIATQLHKVKPTAKSAYYLGNFNLKTKNQKEAIRFFDESATLTTAPFEKAAIYFNLATILSATDKEQARKMIYLATENNPKNGAYYILLANLYENSIAECGTSELEQKAIYQLATQTALKAAQTEARLKPTSEQMVAKYSKNSPTKTDLDQIKKQGGKVTIGCWIKQTVQF